MKKVLLTLLITGLVFWAAIIAVVAFPTRILGYGTGELEQSVERNINLRRADCDRTGEARYRCAISREDRDGEMQTGAVRVRVGDDGCWTVTDSAGRYRMQGSDRHGCVKAADYVFRLIPG